uniref:Laccase-2 n=1 Tax=Cacopsylla melanoneura TaxID=428564 RepID=A0A8D8UU38_9HEMI
MLRNFCLLILIYSKPCLSAIDILPVADTSVQLQVGREDADPQLSKYIQPNDIASGRYDNISTADAEKIGLCARPCDGAKPMVCYYSWTLENYATVGPACGDCLKGNQSHCRRKGCVTADGFERPILSINRQIPGPSIQVCKGDTIVVDVKNHMLDRATTIHWHGVYMKATPYMDGVPMVTQCPIPTGTTFRYKFPATPEGTFFHHSHHGLQKMDGLEGSLVIRSPRAKDPISSNYDYDLYSHVIILTDWMHSMTDSKFPGRSHNDTRAKPDALLINGQNQVPSDNSPRVPMHFFKVQKDKKYRFRIIGGSCLACPLIFTVENHPLLVIASDGTPVEPFTVDTLTMFPGDRVDVVINCNQEPNLFWIQAKTICDTQITAEAVLQYSSGQKLKYVSKRPNSSAFKRGKSLNAMDINPECKSGVDGVCWSQINALKAPLEPNVVLKPVPDKKFVLAVSEFFYTLDALFWKDNDQYQRFFQASPAIVTHMINNRSFMMPPFPPLTQSDPIPPNMVCPTDDSKCTDGSNVKGGKLCECVNIIQVDLGAVAEVIFIDWGSSSFLHPMHLHGTDTYIIEQGLKPKGVDNKAFIQQLQDKLAKNGANLATTKPKPCVKDVVTIPPSGYAVVRIHFNNPGFWMCHCHYIFHSDTGMSMIFQVGTRDQFIKPPPGFPVCNSFMPKVDPDEFKSIKWDDEPT